MHEYEMGTRISRVSRETYFIRDRLSEYVNTHTPSSLVPTVQVGLRLVLASRQSDQSALALGWSRWRTVVQIMLQAERDLNKQQVCPNAKLTLIFASSISKQFVLGVSFVIDCDVRSLVVLRCVFRCRKRDSAEPFVSATCAS